MGSTPISVEENFEGLHAEDGKGTIRVIVADTQAIFRAGLRKIFALEDDLAGRGPGGNAGADASPRSRSFPPTS